MSMHLMSTYNGIQVLVLTCPCICAQALKVPLTDSQLDRLMDMLDKDKDGEVDFG